VPQLVNSWLPWEYASYGTRSCSDPRSIKEGQALGPG